MAPKKKPAKDGKEVKEKVHLDCETFGAVSGDFWRSLCLRLQVNLEDVEMRILELVDGIVHLNQDMDDRVKDVSENRHVVYLDWLYTDLIAARR